MFLLLIALPVILPAQDEPSFGIKFKGYVKSDIFYDSRQTVDAREGHFLLYPKGELPDINGEDINAAGKFNILAIQTRLTGVITGPDAFGAKTSGIIEGAFFGNIGSDINGFRLRHAFVKLTWPKSELLVGQFWHPMFITASYPGTVSFNTGAPFEPFARNPQIRFSHKFGRLKAIATAIEQVDFTDMGTMGDLAVATASPKFLINNGYPELNLRLEFNQKKEDGNEYLVGAGVNYKSLLPATSLTYLDPVTGTPILFRTKERVAGTSLFGYLKLRFPVLTVKGQIVSGQSMRSMTMLGGYAVAQEGFDLSSGKVSYTPLKTFSTWVDIHTNGSKVQGGLFAGYTKNNGALEDVAPGYFFARSPDIDYIYRVAPRLIYNVNKVRIAPEIEYTVAAYGSVQNDGTVADAKEVGNFRFLLGVYYFF
ncbi:MAG: hypothetical protein Kow00127_04820 [Bacteroidales bacterium]